MLSVVLILTTAPVQATDECEAMCQALDAVEETCEANRGDGDSFCEAIGAVEESCDPEDGGSSNSKTSREPGRRPPTQRHHGPRS